MKYIFLVVSRVATRAMFERHLHHDAPLAQQNRALCNPQQGTVFSCDSAQHLAGKGAQESTERPSAMDFSVRLFSRYQHDCRLFRWKDRCDAIVRLEKARNEAARDVTRDGVKFKFPEVCHECSAAHGWFPHQPELVLRSCDVDRREKPGKVCNVKSSHWKKYYQC